VYRGGGIRGVPYVERVGKGVGRGPVQAFYMSVEGSRKSSLKKGRREREVTG